MSDLQKEASTSFAMGSRYKKIAEVFDAMPPRFKLLDLMKAAGIKDSPQIRGTVGAILTRDFRCLGVGIGPKKCWKKP